VDVLVEFQPGAMIGLFEFVGLQEDLKTLTDRKVDLVSKRGLNPLIRNDILPAARILHAA
jgi:hypothetical protein